MNWYKSCFLILLCLGSTYCSMLLGQEMVLYPSPEQAELIGVKQGLSQGMINSIYQDKKGYMWIATKDGLNRFDGYKITTFRNDFDVLNSLPDNYCNRIFEDENENFWVGTNTKGLCLFDKMNEQFYSITLNENDHNNSIQEMQYASGKLAIKTWNDILVFDISEVNVKKDGIKTLSKIKQVFSYNHYQTNKKYQLQIGLSAGFAWLPNQTLWVIHHDSIFQIQPNQDFSNWTLKAYSPGTFGIKENTITNMSIFPVHNQENVVIVAYNNIIQHYNINTNQVIHNITVPEKGNILWSNFYKVNDGSITRISNLTAYNYQPNIKKLTQISLEENSFISKHLNMHYIDANGINWFGSSGFGLIKMDQRKKFFKRFFTNDLSNLVKDQPKRYTLAYDRNVYQNKVQQSNFYQFFSLNGKVNLNLKDNINSHQIQSNIIYTFDQMWNAYNKPLDQIWIFHKNNNKQNVISSIDKETNQIFASYTLPDNIDNPDRFVSQFYLDENNIFWLATIKGLYALSKSSNNYKHYKNIPVSNSSLSSNKLLSICPDPKSPQKYLWIGTEGAGFNRFDKTTGKCDRYDEKDGLPNNVAYCILKDSLDNLWISTNKGLSCFNPQDKTFRNFTEEDGLPGNEFNRYTAFYTTTGELMFGGVDGFVIFNPREVLRKQSYVPIVFTGISIFNKPIKWKKENVNLDSPIDFAQRLTLQPGQNVFSISFASLEFRSNENKMYKYRLAGFDTDWTYPDKKNEVTYTNLSPGTYTFYVMGANTDGVWNEKPISMEIMVLPFWYQTIWFKLLVLLLLGSAIYGFYRYRLQQGLKIEKLRNRIARDLHDEIGSTLSSISIYAEAAKMVSAGNTKAEDILTKINTNTSDMMEAMSDIVWAVNSANDQFSDLANRLRSFAVQMTDAKNIALVFTENKNLPDVTLNMEQRKNIYLICKEAISNAVKYSNCSLLEVLIRLDNGKIDFQIRDNGIGFDLDQFGLKNTGRTFGGNGLKNMQTRAQEIGANVQLNSVLDIGTSIILQLALKKS